MNVRNLHPYFKDLRCGREGGVVQLPNGDYLACTLPLDHPGERHTALWGVHWEWTTGDTTAREVQS